MSTSQDAAPRAPGETQVTLLGVEPAGARVVDASVVSTPLLIIAPVATSTNAADPTKQHNVLLVLLNLNNTALLFFSPYILSLLAQAKCKCKYLY
jgi:hypothetical protein